MAKTPNLFPLKLIVISLGLMLIGGTVFVVVALKDKAAELKKPCSDATVSLATLGEKGQLTSATAKENVIQLVFTDGPNNTVLTLDRCSGALQQRFKITP